MIAIRPDGSAGAAASSGAARPPSRPPPRRRRPRRRGDQEVAGVSVCGQAATPRSRRSASSPAQASASHNDRSTRSGHSASEVICFTRAQRSPLMPGASAGRSAAGQLAKQPRPGHSPLALDSGRRETHHLRRFLDRHAAEEAKLDDATLLRVERFEPREGRVEHGGVDGIDRADRRGRIDRSSERCATPPPRLTRPSRRAWSTRIRRISLAAMPKKCARLCQSTSRCPASFRKASLTSAVVCSV